MRRWIFIFGWSSLLSGAVILDRIAVIAGTHVIKASDIDRDIRLTTFLNRTPLDFNAQAKRDAAERLITQHIIRDDIVSGGYRRPPDSEAVRLEQEIRRDRFGGSEQRLEQALKRCGLTEPELHELLLWQITVLQFINQRFHGGVVIPDEDVQKYYDQHADELKRAYPGLQTFEALEPKIKSVLEGERLNEAFNAWVDQARMNEKVEFKHGAFE